MHKLHERYWDGGVLQYTIEGAPVCSLLDWAAIEAGKAAGSCACFQ